MRTFTMIESPELRAVAEATTQTNTAIVSCLCAQGLDLEKFVGDLEGYRTIHPHLSPIADEMISRTVIVLTDVLLDIKRKSV